MNGTTGAAPFLCSTDENQSVKMLDELNSRYVVIDNQMATDGWVFGKFGAIQTWINDTNGWATTAKSPYVWLDSQTGSAYSSGSNTVPIVVDTDKWNDSITNRLYFQDCDGMSHYRLVYEPQGTYYIDARGGQITGGSGGSQYVQMINGGGTMPMYQSDNYTRAEGIYEMYHDYVVASDQSLSEYIFGARPPVKFVKVFEKVAGATITGSAPAGAMNVTASLTLKTDWDREFTYTETAPVVNGTYSLVVPYPTEKMQGDGYSYGIMPEGKYSLNVGGENKTVDVSESAVMNGGTIQVT